MKVSARNQIKGRIQTLQGGMVNTEVTLALPGGMELAAVITNGSAQSLGLEEGMEAFAVIKASSVMVGKELGNVRLSARNILKGTIEQVVTGAVDDEVTIRIGDASLVAIITKASAERLGLKEGEEAYAVIKASSVMVGVE